MPPSVGDIERSDRALKRSMLRRDAVVEDFQRLYDLANKLKSDPSVIPLFSVQKLDIEQYLVEFTVEQDAIMDALLLAGKEGEYTTSHAPVSREVKRQYYAINAIAHELAEKRPLVQNVRANIHLPKITLPTFSGDILQWPTFRDKFIALVDSDSSLAPIEKFHYLAGCVTDRAANVVNSLKMTDTNYPIIWKKLNDQFDNPRLSATTLVDRVLNFRRIENESASGLTAFLHVFDESLRSLETFNIEDLSSFILFILANKTLPPTTRELFERENNVIFPSIIDLVAFVRDRVKILENVGHPSGKILPKGKLLAKSGGKMVLIAAQECLKTKCPLCKGSHDLPVCAKFLKMQPPKRHSIVSSFHRCFRCLSPTHLSSSCESNEKCATCNETHHTLLHFRKSVSKFPSPSEKNKVIPNTSNDTVSRADMLTEISSGAVSHIGNMAPSTVVLGTALAHARDRSGHSVIVRILIDSASQISAISESCTHRLGLPIKKWTVPVSGLAGASVPNVKGLTTCTISPRCEFNPSIIVKAWVLPKITVNLPSTPLSPLLKNRFSHLALADPSFDVPAPVDLLLGADLYHHVFDGKQYTEGNDIPTAYSSIFGWILIGPVNSLQVPSNQSFVISLTTSLEDMLVKFWATEEPVNLAPEVTENGLCEKVFNEQAYRNDSGRYVVPLPFRDPDPEAALKGSRPMALKRFLNVERKLLTNPVLYFEYQRFMSEYLRLGHMQLATSPAKYFCPHHAVTKMENGKVKIRVVFDASARTPSGKSLNDLLLIGPKLQNDITDILLRFRLPKFVFSADICKMYRQILVRPEHCAFQHILWRGHPDEKVVEYELLTVTYGTGVAPYLAIKVLHQIAEEHHSKFPRVYDAIIQNTYVDDICTGDDTVENTLTLQRELIQVLAEYGFELKKWTSNCPSILENIDPADRSEAAVSFDDQSENYVRILGLHWDPTKDAIGYHVSPEIGVYTKRGVLSVIARLYDPIGLLAPVTFWAKEFLQRLWKLGLHWDTPLHHDLSEEWRSYLEVLPRVSDSCLPRYLDIDPVGELHLCGFCDASNKGYAAVVYLRVISGNETIVYLLGAKSKVAPVKGLTVPRLELCGALLLAQWMGRVRLALDSRITITKMFAWTDSTVVLSWLVNPQIDYKIFVTNRIAKIKRILPHCIWNHISSENNPADCVSRGLLASQLWDNKLYWQGPKMLHNLELAPCFQPLSASNLPECKPNTTAVTLANITTDTNEWFAKYSSLPFAQRVIARMWRYIFISRKQPLVQGPITRAELQKALDTLVRMTQRYYFGFWVKGHQEIDHNHIPKTFRTLRPFVDNDGIIRVGGRLRRSELSNQSKFPILLPKGSHLAMMVLQHYHKCYLHAGPRLLWAMVSRVFWITSSRNEIRKVIKGCVVCTKWAANNPQPVMADLPSPRVTINRPFCHVGVDYGGPFIVRESRRRKSKVYKAYMALFICLSTKAVHIETATELTTEAFLAAFDRFIARRGIPTDVYSDCGTNFTGADRQLQALFQQEENQDTVINATVCHWHFNPPAAPHFGGLWEAGIKSAKFHLKRAIGTHVLTYEELSTILTRIEGILNSRPLTPLSTDPNETDCLTPGHLLIGQPIVALPHRDITGLAENRLNRWQLIQQCHQFFWKRWSREYLSTLQGRSRWEKSGVSISLNDVVIIKTPHAPPNVWKSGRVVEIHPGDDGVVRVVTLKTTNGLLKRPVVQVVKIPTDP